MALFKISKGLKSKLPKTYNEGYCYFTTDDGKMYIDTSNASSGRVCLNAHKADQLATARTITLSGDASGSVSFDGSKNVTLTVDISALDNINDAIDTKQDKITGAATTITDSNLTASRALVSNSSGKVAVSAVTSTELGYLDGVTSNIQTQLDGKLPLTGGTMTGAITFKNTTATPAKGTILNCIQGQYQNAAGNYYTVGLVDLVASAETGTTISSGYARYGSSNGSSFFTAGESGRTMPKALATANALGAENAYIMADGTIEMYAGCANDAATYTKAMTIASSKVTSHVALYGAVWNDYAEFRNQKEEIKPGYCVASADNGQVYKTTEKFQACDGIVSDTFGFVIGETDECKTPLAVAGRVLAYCEGDRYSYHSGDTVCAGPDGRVVKMTREEIREWPDRIVGIVSEIPEYKTWGTANVEVDGRIWIKVV